MKLGRYIMKSKIVFFCLSLSISLSVNAEELLKDFDSLGGNKVLLDKAKALNPQTTVGIVQDRIVSRRNRFEVAFDPSFVLGGDPYIATTNYGLSIHYHITPHWSLGARYNVSTNSLRDEAKYLIHDQTATGSGIIPDIDYPQSQALLLLNWYPIYGKMNVYDLGVSHFDVYATLGGGKIQLASGSTNTVTAGGGVGLWVSQHFTTRLEMRWQGYSATHPKYRTTQAMNMTVAGLQMGYLF